MDFPKLPPLDDFDDVKPIINEDLYKSIENEAGQDLPDLPDIGEDIDLEEDFQDLNEVLNSDELDDFIIEDGDFENIEDGDFEDIEEKLENVQEKLENVEYKYIDNEHFEEELEDNFSFLPEVAPELIEELPKAKSQDKKDKKLDKHKELDDEAVKAFFFNLKNKIIKPKNKMKSEAKVKKPKDKIKKPKDKSKIKPKDSKLSKLKKPLIIIISVLILITVVFLLFNAFGSRDKELADLSYNNKSDEAIILIDNFDRIENNINVTLKNNGETISRFFIDIELSSKVSIFKKENFVCKSDIIFLEIGEETQTLLDCENFLESDKYSMSVNFVEIK